MAGAAVPSVVGWVAVGSGVAGAVVSGGEVSDGAVVGAVVVGAVVGGVFDDDEGAGSCGGGTDGEPGATVGGAGSAVCVASLGSVVRLGSVVSSDRDWVDAFNPSPSPSGDVEAMPVPSITAPAAVAVSDDRTIAATVKATTMKLIPTRPTKSARWRFSTSTSSF